MIDVIFYFIFFGLGYLFNFSQLKSCKSEYDLYCIARETISTFIINLDLVRININSFPGNEIKRLLDNIVEYKENIEPSYRDITWRHIGREKINQFIHAKSILDTKIENIEPILKSYLIRESGNVDVQRD